MHTSAFVFVAILLHNNWTQRHLWQSLSAQGARQCVYMPTSAYRCAPRHMQEVNRTNRTYMSMFPSSAVWFKQGHSVSCIPQAPFPFNSLDVVLSLGLCGRARGIIYCLFSKANVQGWHISFAEYISLLKCDFGCVSHCVVKCYLGYVWCMPLLWISWW